MESQNLESRRQTWQPEQEA